jgi:hypothetical protein
MAIIPLAKHMLLRDSANGMQVLYKMERVKMSAGNIESFECPRNLDFTYMQEAVEPLTPG